jgi:predicted nuclease of restriction endonuclease-like (RecB) superfamily
MSIPSDSAKRELDFESLVTAIQTANEHFTSQASRAINISVTLRSWVIGCYIVEYEQGGRDRAAYGMRLIDELSKKLSQLGLTRVESRDLRRYRSFAISYPQILQSLTAKSPKLLPDHHLAMRSAIRQSVTAISGERLISSLSFTHICELLRCEEPEKRAFYEDQCIRGCWSVRELKRQIASLLYERSELSINKQKLAEKTHASTEGSSIGQLTIRDPFIFEFLGLTPQEVMSESHLEDQLLDKLQEFLLELGQGFCFEARQRRILIGDTYYFVDLVFYHRILKCHVLVDLKLEGFTHENIGQLNTYVSWFDKNVREQGDNPPIGILLCTEKDHALVQYALAAMDNALFVSKYQLQLPTPEVLKQQLEAERRRIEAEQVASQETDSR